MKKSDITRLARELRQKQTFEEYVLWQKLRGRRFHGVKFLRQHPIIYDKVGKGFSFFIPDFYSLEKSSSLNWTVRFTISKKNMTKTGTIY